MISNNYWELQSLGDKKNVGVTFDSRQPDNVIEHGKIIILQLQSMFPHIYVWPCLDLVKFSVTSSSEKPTKTVPIHVASMLLYLPFMNFRSPTAKVCNSQDLNASERFFFYNFVQWMSLVHIPNDCSAVACAIF